jgi:hypothetical protein
MIVMVALPAIVGTAILVLIFLPMPQLLPTAE